MSDSGTWKEYSKLVLSEIERMDGSVQSLSKEVANMRTDLAVHEVQIGRSSSFYGAVSGMVVAIITAVIINFVTKTSDNDKPKLIYKDESNKIELQKNKKDD